MKSNGPVPDEQFDEDRAAYVRVLYGDASSEKVADWLQDCAKAVCVQRERKSALKAIIGMSREVLHRACTERARSERGVAGAQTRGNSGKRTIAAGSAREAAEGRREARVEGGEGRRGFSRA